MRNVQSLKLHMIIVVLLFFLGTFLGLNAQVWVPVSDYSTINSTDKYLLVDMLSGKAVGVQGKAPKYNVKVVTVNFQESGMIVNDELIQDNIKWTFTKLSDGYYISSQAGKSYKLYCDNTALYVSTSPNNNVKWQLDYKIYDYIGFFEKTSGRVLCLSGDVWKMYVNNIGLFLHYIPKHSPGN